MNDYLKSFFKDVFSLRKDMMTNRDIRSNIIENSEVKGTNLSVLMLAVLIACIGLYQNNIPVIIGAMLISPMMGCIMAIGYGLAVFDSKLVRRSSLSLLIEVTVSILTATIFFLLVPESKQYAELLARTKPTLFDVLIAICGGLAGIIGVTRQEKGNVLPGVAIATAIIPPLCTAGFGIANGQIIYLTKALYLFLINTFFIAIMTAVFVRVLSLPYVSDVDEKEEASLRSRMIISALIVIIPSIIIGYNLVLDSIKEANVENYLASEFNFSDTQIVSKSVDYENLDINIVLIGKVIAIDKIDRIIAKKYDYELDDYKIKVVQNEVSDGVSKNELQEILDSQNEEIKSEILTQEIEDLRKEIEVSSNLIEKYQSKDFDYSSLKSEIIALYPKIKEISAGYLTKDNQEEFLLIITSEEKMTDNQIQQLQSFMKTKISVSSIKIIDESLENIDNQNEEKLE